MIKINGIYFITSNPHKFEEVKYLINSNLKLDTSFYHLKMKYPEIQGKDLEEIALSSLGLVLSTISVNDNNLYFLEDAGLFIETLNGFPGPYSSYVFSTLGWQGILKLMKDESNRNAFFKSVVATYYNKEIRLFTGVTFGEITIQQHGEKGFGFDPIFRPKTSNKTFAEMVTNEKNQYSHRSKAILEMINWIKKA